MGRFCLKNRRFDGKRRTKSMSAGSHSETHYWLEDSADWSFVLAWCRPICPKGHPLNRKLYVHNHYFLRYCYLNHPGWIRDRHTILLGDAFKGRNDPAVGSTKYLFFSPVVRQPLCFEVLENCSASNLTFNSQSLILFGFAKVTSTTAMIFIMFNSSSLSCNISFSYFELFCLPYLCSTS